MENNGMNSNSMGQTIHGGEMMELQEIKLGQVTYVIQRVYGGDRPASEFVLDKLTQSTQPVSPFDEGGPHEV